LAGTFKVLAFSSKALSVVSWSKHQKGINMYRTTVVTLPSAVGSDGAVHEWLVCNETEWREALDLEVDYLDDRATYMWHTVNDVTVENGQVTVYYTVEYDAYYGCRDMDFSDEDERVVVGRVANGAVVFQTYVQPQQMAPDEEF